MVEEKKDERRSFIGPEGIDDYFIAPPSAEDIRGADWQYSKTYTKCLVEGITTNAEMTDILTRRGIIGPEFEKRANELASDLNEKLEQLGKAESMDDKRDLAIEVAAARDELFQWNQRLSGPMNNTCESISDDARLEYLTSCMVQIKDGSRVWESYDKFLKDRTNALPIKARFEVMLYLQGLESDFLDKTPEAVAMQEVQDKIIADAEEAIRAHSAVKEEEAKIEEIEEIEEIEDEVIPKKYTKKKKPTAKKKSRAKKE